MVCYGISGVINNVHYIPNGMATSKPTKTLKNFRKISLCEMFLLPVIQMLDSPITVNIIGEECLLNFGGKFQR